MIFNYSNPEGNTSYYGNQFNPSYGFNYNQQTNVPKNRFLSSTFAFKNGLSLGGGGMYNTRHGGMPGGSSPGISGKGLGHIVASANILRNKLIQIKDYQNGKSIRAGGLLVKKGTSHFDRSWTKSLIYGKNYPSNDSKTPHKSIFTYIDEDKTDGKYPGYKKRNTDYRSLFDKDNDEELIRAREDFKKEKKARMKTDYKNSHSGRKKVKFS